MHPQLKFTGRGWPKGGLMPAETFHISFICLGHFLILFFFFELLPAKHFELTHGQTSTRTRTHTCTCNSRVKIIGRYFAYFMVEGRRRRSSGRSARMRVPNTFNENWL